MFGPLAALFSGFAFAGVIVTIIMQMEELRLAREVSDKAATAQQGSEKALKDQIEKCNFLLILLLFHLIFRINIKILMKK